jgi:peptidoglycan/LPS O-acetylase OafA/YrhL
MASRPESPTPNAGRLAELDVLRAAAIIAVVFLHAYVLPPPGTPVWEVRAMHALHLFAHTAVPVFLFASGFLLARERARDDRSFWANKARRIFVPAFLMMAAIGVFRVAAEGWAPREAAEAFLRFNTAGQYYFVLVLLVCYALFRLAGPKLQARGIWAVAGLSLVVAAATIGWYEARPPEGEGAVDAYRNPLLWIGYYALGYAFGRSGWELSWPRAASVAGMALMALAAAFYVLQGEAGNGYPRSYFGISVFGFTVGALLAYPALARRVLAALPPLAGASRWLARYSFGIFLIHAPFFIGPVSLWLGLTGAEPAYLAGMAALAAFGLGGSLALLVLVDYLAPEPVAVLFGIEPRPARRDSGRSAVRRAPLEPDAETRTAGRRRRA